MLAFIPKLYSRWKDNTVNYQTLIPLDVFFSVLTIPRIFLSDILTNDKSNTNTDTDLAPFAFLYYI